MLRTLVGLILAFALVTETPPTPAAEPVASLDQAVDKILAQRQRELHIPGLALVIVKNDRVIYAKTLGERDIAHRLPVTLDTLFPIGSCTKSFTAVAAARSAAAGLLNLDSHPQAFLPWFKMHDPVANARVTLRDMLSHRTGLLAYADLAAEPGVLTMDEYARAETSAKPAVPFREKFQYSNAMIVAAGEAVAAANHSTWSDVIRNLVFRPLHMNASTPDVFAAMHRPNHTTGYVYDTAAAAWRAVSPPSSMKALAPAGAIAASANDMTQWLRMLSNSGSFEGHRFLTKAMFAELTKPEIAVNATQSYALGLVTYKWNGFTVIEHNGGSEGISALESVIPSQHAGFAFLANTSHNYMTKVGNAGNLLWPIILGMPSPTSPKAATADLQVSPSPTVADSSLPSTDALLLRMVEAVGGRETLLRHTSLVIDAKKDYENQGVTAALTIRAQKPAMRTEDETWHAAGRTIARLHFHFDGTGGGQQTTFGQNARNDAASNAQAARDDAFRPLLDMQRLYKSVDVVGRTRLGGDDAFLVQLTPSSGSAVMLSVSTASGLILSRASDGTSEAFADYRPVDGERIPFRTTIQDGLGETSVTIRRARFNATIPATAFGKDATLTLKH